MRLENSLEIYQEAGEEVPAQAAGAQAEAVERLLAHAGVECALGAVGDGPAVLIEAIDRALADLLLAKRKKDVEEDEELDDEEEEEEEDEVEDEEEDEDEDFEDEDEDEFEEEFDDDELDDDDDDIFYDDDDDE